MNEDFKLDEKSREYHFEEYRLLKSELLDTIKESYKAAIYSFSSNVAIISYFITSIKDGAIDKGQAVLLLFLPISIVAIAYAYYRLRRNSAAAILAYIAKIEPLMAHERLGWERYYTQNIRQRSKYFRTPVVMNLVFGAQVVMVLLFYFVFLR